jgi:hypothetical protein
VSDNFVVVRVANSYVKSYVKDPTARLDYTWDWSDWLADIDDTMSTATPPTVTLPDGLTAADPLVVDGPFVTQRVEGGTLESTYQMVCQITTAGGLIDQRTIYLTIKDR